MFFLGLVAPTRKPFIGIDLVKDRTSKKHAPVETTRVIELLREEGMMANASNAI